MLENSPNYEAIVEEMMANGYKTFKPNHIFGRHSKNAFQKKYKDDSGIKYFITCHEYDWSGYEDSGRPYHKSWVFDGQFQLKDGRSFNFETVGWFFYPTNWGHKVCTLKDVEIFFDSLWLNMECIHYELNYSELKDVQDNSL